MIRYLLDTNILILVMMRRDAAAVERFSKLSAGLAAISSITVGELALGWEKSQRPKATRTLIQSYIDRLSVLSVDAAVACEYGKVRGELEKAGTPIGMNDTWLASHARCLGLTLVTRNLREFVRVRGLVVEDWGSAPGGDA